MSELMNVLKKATEAIVAGDAEGYLACVSERTKKSIEALGGIGPMMEISKAGIELFGTESIIELTLATVDQFKLVDGKLESVSLETLSETESFDRLIEKSKENIEFLAGILSDEKDEIEEREFQMTREQFDRLMEELKDEYMPDGIKTRIIGDVCIIKVPGDFPYMNLIEGLQTQ